MAALNQNVPIWAGDDNELDISLFEEDGTTPINVGGAVINWAMSSTFDTSVKLVNKTSEFPTEIELTTPETGQIKVFLIPDDTKNLGGEPYIHEVEVVSGGKTVTVLRGNVTIYKTIMH